MWKMVRIWIGRWEETHSGIETQHKWIQLSGGSRRRLARLESPGKCWRVKGALNNQLEFKTES